MASPARTVASTFTEITKVMMPNDANFLGKVFGGAILEQIDLCAYATSGKFSGNVCVTASFDRVDFHDAIEVGEIVTFRGHISYVGRTSMEVTVEIFATDVRSNSTRHTNTARVTMVALKDGKPTPVPRLTCETREEKLRFLEGSLRRSLRGEQRQLLADQLATLQAADEATLDAAYAAETF